MCGRYSLINAARLAAKFPRFSFEEFSENRLPRYNVAPTQDVLGVRNDGRDRVEVMRWGIDGRINIRAESIAARHNPIGRRCIEFADGFYEWRGKQPVYYTLRSGEPFAFAGLWQPGEDARAHCDIITCPPNALVAPVHNRMPVILPQGAIDLWLSPEALPPDIAGSMLQPYDADAMIARDVSRRVNNANYDAPDVLGPDDSRQTMLDL
jgi:putative SOS response-associated peptidase YedK